MKLFVMEVGSAQVRGLLEGPNGADIILASRLAHAEASVCMARLVHLGRVAAADLPRLLGSLDDYWEQSIQEIPISDEVLDQARQLAQRFPLRTDDAIHLASAREARKMLRGQFDGEITFVAFDTAMLEAARDMGLRVLDSR